MYKIIEKNESDDLVTQSEKYLSVLIWRQLIKIKWILFYYKNQFIIIYAIFL